MKLVDQYAREQKNSVGQSIESGNKIMRNQLSPNVDGFGLPQQAERKYIVEATVGVDQDCTSNLRCFLLSPL
jgi:hypothetical protein